MDHQARLILRAPEGALENPKRQSSNTKKIQDSNLKGVAVF